MEHSLCADHVSEPCPVEELTLVLADPPGTILSDGLDLMLPTATLFVHVPRDILPYGVDLLLHGLYFGILKLIYLFL